MEERQFQEGLAVSKSPSKTAGPDFGTNKHQQGPGSNAASAPAPAPPVTATVGEAARRPNLELTIRFYV